MVTNRRIVDFDGADFYPTPTWATIALLQQETFHGIILEPCCGDGAISKILNENGLETISYDKYNRGFGSVQDAFKLTGSIYDNIITNPPFAIAEKLINHFMDKFDHKMCMLLRTSFLESAGRYDRLWSINPPARVHIFSERLSMYPAGQQGVKGGGTTSYAWFCFDKNIKVKAPEIYWIKPGLKPNSRRKKNV